MVIAKVAIPPRDAAPLESRGPTDCLLGWFLVGSRPANSYTYPFGSSTESIKRWRVFLKFTDMSGMDALRRIWVKWMNPETRAARVFA